MHSRNESMAWTGVVIIVILSIAAFVLLHYRIKGHHHAPTRHSSSLDRDIQDNRSADVVLVNRFKQATVEDYNDWMKAYVRTGDQPTSYSTHGCYTDRLFVATSDFRMRPLYGAQSITVIVPKNVEFLGGDLGHSTLLYMDGSTSNPGFVDAYADTNVPGVKSVAGDVMPHLRPATEQEYNRWARGQKKPLGYYADRYFVAKESFDLLPMHGANSITVFAPPGVKIGGKALGHNEVHELAD